MRAEVLSVSHGAVECTHERDRCFHTCREDAAAGMLALVNRNIPYLYNIAVYAFLCAVAAMRANRTESRTNEVKSTCVTLSFSIVLDNPISTKEAVTAALRQVAERARHFSPLHHAITYRICTCSYISLS